MRWLILCDPQTIALLVVKDVLMIERTQVNRSGVPQFDRVCEANCDVDGTPKHSVTRTPCALLAMPFDCAQDSARSASRRGTQDSTIELSLL